MKEKEELLKILKLLDKDKLSYVIIRNFEFITSGPIGKDVDICVKKQDYNKIKKLLLKNNWVHINTCNAAYHEVFYKILTHKTILSIHLHIGGVSGINVHHYPVELLLNNSEVIKGFRIPKITYALFSIIIHVLFDRRIVQEKYREYFNKIKWTLIDKELLAKILNNYFSNPKTVILLLKEKNYDYLEKIMPELRKNYYTNKKLAMLNYKLRLYKWGFTRVKSCKLVSIIGMDGTGKSTLINNLDKLYSTSLIKHKMYYFGRGKNNIIPIQKFGKGIAKKVETKELKELKEKFNLQRTLAAPIFAFDLLLRYLFVILPQRKLNDLVITDRFTTDVLLMKGVPKTIKQILYFFMPKSDLLIYLHNKPKILSKRKNHPVQDLKRQELLFKKILNNDVNKIESISEQQVFEEVNKLIYKQLE